LDNEQERLYIKPVKLNSEQKRRLYSNLGMLYSEQERM
jgi:hypothetical protein